MVHHQNVLSLISGSQDQTVGFQKQLLDLHVVCRDMIIIG